MTTRTVRGRRPHRLAAFTAAAALALSAASAAAAKAPAALVTLHTEVHQAGKPFPRFVVDAAWPDVPADLILGQVSGVSVDADDVVWLVNRPGSLDATETGPLQNPPIADCCRPAPPVVRFAQDGTYLGGWGGPDTGPMLDGVNQWPTSVHGIYVDADRTVWIGGNGDDDHVVLNFTADGEFIRAIGRRQQHGGNTDTETLGRPADVFHGNGQILIADGYSNRRLIRFAAADGAFDGYWGAYAEPPVALAADPGGRYDPASRHFADIVHCVVTTDDGHVYVCDRRNNRAQLFRQDADGGLSFVRDIVVSPESGATGTVTDIALSPDGRFVYVAEMVNSRIWILDRKTHEPVAAIGRIGRQAGQFTWLHSIDVDGDGNLYATEVFTGRRAQKLVLTGIR
ncbi:MAG: beta-propeller fold lactonase family protein [Pseudomonadales bacterium]